MIARWRTPAALLFLLALTAGFYWQLALSHEYTWLENPDQALQVRPWFDFEAREFHAGRLPLWDPYQVGGQSLIGQVQPGLANPLNWILFAMPLRDGHIPLGVLHWYWLGIHWIAAVFTYALCRDLGAGWGASIAGAAVWAFGGFIGHSATPQFLMSALFIPLILLFYARVFRGRRPFTNAALCGASMGLAFLSGHHNIPIYTAVLLAGLWLWYLASREWRGRAMHAAVFALICLLISGLQMLPAIEYGRRAVRWAGTPEPQHWKDRIPYSVHAEYSLHARSIPGMVIPGLGVHANPWIGIVALSTALIAIAVRWRSPRVRMLAAVALGGILLALGADSPVHRLAYLLVPMVEKARYPAMAIVISQAALAALAAIGVDALAGRDASRRVGMRRRRTTDSESCGKSSGSGRLPKRVEMSLDAADKSVCATTFEEVSRRQTRVSAPRWLVGFALAIFGIYGGLALVHRAPTGHPAWIIAAVALVWAAALRWWPSAWGGALPVVALALFFVEGSTVPLPIQRQNQPGSLLKPVADEADIADFLHRQPGWFRVQFDEDAVPVNFGDFYSIEQFGGYVASMPASTLAILGDQRTPRWFGIRYYVGNKPSKPDQVQVFQSRTGLKVYQNPGIPDPLGAEHDTPCDSPDALQLTERTSESTTIDVTLGCSGRVLVGDSWFPGWRAWIDGRRVRIQEYQGILGLVPVPSGHHRIEYRYRPGSVYWGAGLSAIGVVLCVLIYRLEARARILHHNTSDSLVAAR